MHDWEIAAQRPTQPVKSCAQPWQKQRTKVAVFEKFDGSGYQM